MNLNKVQVAGRLTRDPELRYLPNGTAICQIGVAVNRSWKSDNGEKKEEVTFVDVTLWGKTGENVSQYLKKGQPIYVEGRLKLEEWDDKTTGKKRLKLGVVGESFQFVGGKEGGTQAASRPAAPKSAEQPPDDNEQVPF